MKKLYIGCIIFVHALFCMAENLDFLDQGTFHIRNLKVNLLNNENVSESYIKAHIPFKAGNIVRTQDFDTGTKQLFDTGWVDDLTYDCKQVSDTDVDIVLNIKVCPRVESFYFIGNKHFKDNALIYEMKSRIHEPLNQQRLQADVQRLEKFYASKGYYQAKVKILSEPTKKNYARIVVKIDEGLHFKIKDIRFIGLRAFKENELLDVLRTKTWGIFSWFTKSGIYSEDLLQQDITALQDFYKNAGYLDVEIDRSRVKVEENGEKIRITFSIEEGEKYTVGNIHIISEEEQHHNALIACMAIKKGSAAGPDAIEQACESIRDFYGKQGYVDAQVEVQRSLGEHNTIDLAFNVTKGLQYRIHSIYITGNVHTQARVILRELNLAPGDILNRKRMKRAEQRLQNTGFFKTVLVTTEDCNSACEKDLKIAVEENKTGSIFFSGGLNSVEKFTFGVTLSQNNFDYKNSKDYYRGAGQKFQLSTTLGHYSNSIDLSFEEPWLFDRELRFGFNLFRTMNKFSGDDYKEQRLGGEFYLGKRLFEQVEGKLYYHLERFKLTDVSDKISQVIKDEKGSRIISKVGFLMERDTRNHFLYPTKGSYLAWDNQIAGLGGKTKYFRTRATAARWFLVHPDHEQTLLIGGKMGTVRGFGGKTVPLFEREFLGGPDDLRGFDYHEVGPKSNDSYKENLGGQSFAFIKTEYSVKMNSILRVVGFFDAGKVKKFNNITAIKDSGNFNSDAGFGLRIHVMGAPFRLDFAFPLKTDAYNKRKAPVIAYSFGVSF